MVGSVQVPTGLPGGYQLSTSETGFHKYAGNYAISATNLAPKKSVKPVTLRDDQMHRPDSNFHCKL